MNSCEDYDPKSDHNIIFSNSSLVFNDNNIISVFSNNYIILVFSNNSLVYNNMCMIILVNDINSNNNNKYNMSMIFSVFNTRKNNNRSMITVVNNLIGNKMLSCTWLTS